MCREASWPFRPKIYQNVGHPWARHALAVPFSPEKIMHHPDLAVRAATHPARNAAQLRIGHIHVVTVLGAAAGALGEHHGKAAVDDDLERVRPTGALVLRAFATLAEGAMSAPRRRVVRRLR